MIEYEVVGDDRRPAVWLSIVLIAIGILGCFTSTAFCPLALRMTAQNPSGLHRAARSRRPRRRYGFAGLAAMATSSTIHDHPRHSGNQPGPTDR